MNRLTLMVMALVILGGLALTGCESKGPRDTPEGTILALKETILEGRADRIGDFFYAEDPEMRKLMRRLGVFLGNVQKMGTSVQAKFPDEVAALKAQAEEAAKNGKATSFLSQMTSQMGGPGRRRAARAGTGGGDAMRSSFDSFLKSLMADPYGWAEQAETRLTTAFLTDDSVALLWDDQPILSPLGMTMRRAEDDRWYIVLPTGAPGVGSLMPQTPDQYKIFGSLIATFDNVVIDLRADVENGRVANLEQLSQKAGEKAFLPVAAAVFAYANYTSKMPKGEPAKKPGG
ncbi:MAG: hypothetical protein HBSAPP03_00310 [Phycisphaerae bacterium]|nr:MAG: hypothetical protein HBSAPP03_00310 [Phycisphaerae bacterium]